jgi:hypothetical protein
MSSLRSVGRSAATLDKDRASACRFTFSDGRRCRTPRSSHHPHFCFDHARKESQACAADKLANDLAYISAGHRLLAHSHPQFRPPKTSNTAAPPHANSVANATTLHMPNSFRISTYTNLRKC